MSTPRDVESLMPSVEPVLAALRVATQPGFPVDEARALLRGRLQAMRDDALSRGVSTRDTDDATYALVALADEAMLARPGVRDAWLGGLLQLALFGENTAGEGFFARLDALRRERSRAHVLLVFQLALLLGFRGRLASDEPARLDLIESLHVDLVRFGARSGVAQAPTARPKVSTRERPGTARWTLATGVCALLLAGIVWMVFALDLLVHATQALPA